MEKERETLSPHELSKYDYCPYQWYYERLYGRKELRRLYRERNERLHLADSMGSAFRKGESYHRRSYRMLRLKRAAQRLALLVLALAAGYAWIRYGR